MTDGPYPATLSDVVLELREMRQLLETLVAQGEERRAGERQLEDFIFAGDEPLIGEPPTELSDDALVQNFYRTTDGRYGIDLPDGSRRDATPTETKRLKELTGRRRKV